MDKNKLYQSLYDAYVKANPTKSRKDCQEYVIKKWNDIKNDSDLPSKCNNLLTQFKAVSMQKKGTLMGFWGKQSAKASAQMKDNSLPLEFLPDSHQFDEPDDEAVVDKSIIEKPSGPTSSLNQSNKIAIVQLQLQTEIDVLNSELTDLYERDKKGLLSETQEKEFKSKKLKKIELENKLKKKKDDQRRSQKARDDKKRKFEAIFEENPELRKALKIRDQPGRPRLEADQPLLLKAIVDLALHGSASHEKRQSDVYRSIKTLDQLADQLSRDGFKISRSGLYIRLLPKRSSSLEGQRHVSTVPVKLIRAQNDKHVKHIDGPFCTATIRHLEELASTLGPDEVCFISQDDKCRVPIGLTAANKQSPLLMHVEYRVSLPDHDWVVAEKHKLIPSVYAGINIQSNGLGDRQAVGYSGPTYIAIRSGKHSSSTAYSHAFDFEKLLLLPEFDSITKSGVERLVKPVVVFTVDGGPDENPRYQKVIKVALHHFVKHDLDALFIATNAPGRSAFNRVERKMAPLSKELSGLILPHDQFGSHLDNRGQTIDSDLEKKNFAFAGTVLAEIWSKMVVDNFPTVAEYVNPGTSELLEEELLNKDQNWCDVHIRSSQYFAQIVKCADLQCCSKPRSSYFNIVQERFLLPPLPLVQTSEGLRVPERSGDMASHTNFPSLFLAQSLKIDHLIPRSANKYKQIPYDLYCPSVQSSLNDRVCKTCNQYFASIVMLRIHSAQHKQVAAAPARRVRPTRLAARRQREMMVIIANQENGESVDWFDEQDLDLTGIAIPNEEPANTPAFPVLSMKDHFQSPWEEE